MPPSLRIAPSGQIAPTLHLNGSGLERLEQGLSDQIAALRAAREVMQANAPHPRDYYPQGEDAGLEARRQHQVRLSMLEKLVSELEEGYEDLQRQAGERRKRT